MGLMAPQLRHRPDASVLPPQLHRGATLDLADHRQQAPVATEGGILLAAVDPTGCRSLNPAAATQQACGQQEQQQRRSDRCQSSKRELLSRGRDVDPLLRELRGAGRLLELSGRPEGLLDVAVLLALKAASSAAGRLG